MSTIPMVRDEPAFAGGPVTADVHPDEVANFAAAGWERADGKVAPAQEAPKAASEPTIGDLRKTAKALGLTVSPKMTAAEITAAIEAANG